MENLGEDKALEILKKLEANTAKTLIDSELINHLNEKSGIPFYDMKLIMIEDENGFHLIGMKGISPSYHSIIALIYMLEFEKSMIKILGGGLIRLENGEFIISGKSGSFDAMEKEKVNEVMKNLNIEFKMPHPSLYPRKGTEHSYENIIKEVHNVLSD